jgi:phosphatidylserine/phosphatidylglycerophosphate/cardiolipin synthase-like enzyme
MFSPGGGRRITRRIAGAVHRAQKRVRVCSPVITAGPILGALAEIATEGKVDLSGVCDATQMHEVLGQWHSNAESSWKTGAFLTLVSHASFAGKRSTPYAPGSIHDYMHAKITVADDVVFIGSYNLSHSGQDNAENVCEIHDARLAESMATFIDQVHERYPRAEFTSAPTAPNTSSGSPPPLP